MRSATQSKPIPTSPSFASWRSKAPGLTLFPAASFIGSLEAGGNPAKCTFAGVGKSREEIEYALRCEVLSFNVESEQELSAINEIAKSLSKRAPIAIRVNPDVSANTHKYISTGKTENKFGIAIDRVAEVYNRARRMNNIKIRGVQMHIGSQITETKPFVQAIEKMLPLVRQLKSDCGIEFFSIGGGIGIVYRGSLRKRRQGLVERGGTQTCSDNPGLRRSDRPAVEEPPDARVARAGEIPRRKRRRTLDTRSVCQKNAG